jgi:hypoxanthine-guanine phosphoribosyltransferase
VIQQQQLKKEYVLLRILEGEDVFHPDLCKAISVVGTLPFDIRYVFSCNEAMESSVMD